MIELINFALRKQAIHARVGIKRTRRLGKK